MQFSQSKLPPTKESHFLFRKVVPCVKKVLGHLSQLLTFLTYTGYYKGMSDCLATLHVPTEDPRLAPVKLSPLQPPNAEDGDRESCRRTPSTGGGVE